MINWLQCWNKKTRRFEKLTPKAGPPKTVYRIALWLFLAVDVWLLGLTRNVVFFLLAIGTTVWLWRAE